MSGGDTTTYVWDGPHIIAEYLNGSLTRKYIYGPGIDNPIVMINVSGTTETWYYYYTDALGSVRLITDHTGTIKESYVYDPFGRPHVIISGGTDGNWLTEDTTTLQYSMFGNPYMFTARRWDSSANLYYYRFRDYQPDLGRFCQPDPLHYIDVMNLYAYCCNNPINWLDPWGLKKKKYSFWENLLKRYVPAGKELADNADLAREELARSKKNLNDIGRAEEDLRKRYRTFGSGVKNSMELPKEVAKDLAKKAAGKLIIDPALEGMEYAKKALELKEAVEDASKIIDAIDETTQQNVTKSEGEQE